MSAWRNVISVQGFFSLILLGALPGCGQKQPPAETRTPTGQELLRVWSASDANARERAAAVNRCFTNGTPIPIIVSVLGTNYGVLRPISTVEGGPGPEPRETCSLFYKFGQEDEGVTIGTTADVNGDPLTGEFTGAGFSVLPATHPIGTTGKIWIGQADGSQPAWAKQSKETTNRIWIGRADGNQPEWMKQSTGTTNGIWFGQTNGATNPSHPVPP